MTRFLLPLTAVALVAASALGQGFTHPLPTPPPGRDPVTGRPVPWPGGMPPGVRPFPPITVPWFGSFGYYSYWPSYPYSYDSWYLPAYDYPTAPAPVAPNRPADPNAPPPIVPELPAEWTIEFPVSADVTLNGHPAPGDGAVRKMTSPPLKPGETYTFAVTAKWTADGKRYEWDRTLTLGSGQRSRSVVARGFLVEK